MINLYPFIAVARTCANAGGRLCPANSLGTAQTANKCFILATTGNGD